MWSLGNEINLEGANTPAAWRFVNELARMIKHQDPNHPVISVISYDNRTLNNIAGHAPDLDAVGINAYGALSGVRAMIDASALPRALYCHRMGCQRPLGGRADRMGAAHRTHERRKGAISSAALCQKHPGQQR